MTVIDNVLDAVLLLCQCDPSSPGHGARRQALLTAVDKWTRAGSPRADGVGVTDFLQLREAHGKLKAKMERLKDDYETATMGVSVMHSQKERAYRALKGLGFQVCRMTMASVNDARSEERAMNDLEKLGLMASRADAEGVLKLLATIKEQQQ